MNPRWKFYTYPGCTSCRQAQAWLSQAEIDVERIHIYNDPPPMEALRQMVQAHPRGIAAFISTRGRKYRELGLKDKDLSEEEWFDLIEKEPWLLRRPILWDGKNVLVGWKETEFESILGRNDGT